MKNPLKVRLGLDQVLTKVSPRFTSSKPFSLEVLTVASEKNAASTLLKKETYISYDKAYILVSISKYKVFYISVTKILWRSV